MELLESIYISLQILFALLSIVIVVSYLISKFRHRKITVGNLNENPPFNNLKPSLLIIKDIYQNQPQNNNIINSQLKNDKLDIKYLKRTFNFDKYYKTVNIENTLYKSKRFTIINEEMKKSNNNTSVNYY